MESGHVYGIGIGLIILFVLWTAAFLCCFLPHSHGRLPAVGVVGFLFASVVTLILIFLPRSPEDEVEVKTEIPVVDDVFIYRIILIIIMGSTLIACLLFTLFTHWFQQIRAKPYKK